MRQTHRSDCPGALLLQLDPNSARILSLIRLAGLLLLPIFILSGFAGLIYQSLWSQYLGLFLGHSSYAQSAAELPWLSGITDTWISVILRSAGL